MWRVTSLLEDTCVHVGQKVALAGSVRATVGRIFIKEGKVSSSEDLSPVLVKFLTLPSGFFSTGDFRLRFYFN